jgi:hypothetical protein
LTSAAPTKMNTATTMVVGFVGKSYITDTNRLITVAAAFRTYQQIIDFFW